MGTVGTIIIVSHRTVSPFGAYSDNTCQKIRCVAYNDIFIQSHMCRMAEAFSALSDKVIVVADAFNIELCKKELKRLNFDVNIVEDGEDFIGSINIGLSAIGTKCDTIVVHEGAWPYASKTEINDVIEASKETTAIIGTRAIDTVKVASDDILSTIDRQYLWCLKSPLAAKYADLKVMCESLYKERDKCYDLPGFVTLLHAKSQCVRVVEGRYENEIVRLK